MILGLISSIIFTIGTLANALPNKDVIDSFAYLNRESKENAVVFSYYVKGQWISSLGKRKNVMDPNFLLAPDASKRYMDIDTAFSTKTETKALELMKKYDAKYIYVSDKTIKKYGEIKYLEDENCFKRMHKQPAVYKILC